MHCFECARLYRDFTAVSSRSAVLCTDNNAYPLASPRVTFFLSRVPFSLPFQKSTHPTIHSAKGTHREHSQATTRS